MLNGYEYEHQLRCVECDCDHEVIAMRCERSQSGLKYVLRIYIETANSCRNSEYGLEKISLNE